jgi:AcrR family transcriptional regulator
MPPASRPASPQLGSAMAKVDPERRAQIGQEKRAKTRALLVSAAISLFARRAVEAVTVDDVVNEAGVAKGTFYFHFEDLHALTAAVADELIETFDELLQPQRLSISDPLMRIAFGCNSFIEKALEDRSWATVVARMASSHPTVGQIARTRLLEDLQLVLKQTPGQDLSLELSLEVVIGIMLQVLAAIGEGRLSSRDRQAAIGCILRVIGFGTPQVRSTLAQLPKIELTGSRAEPSDRRPVQSKRAKERSAGRRHTTARKV